jgi:5-formyltetrahydrofolate cyclo-ligase
MAFTANDGVSRQKTPAPHAGVSLRQSLQPSQRIPTSLPPRGDMTDDRDAQRTALRDTLRDRRRQLPAPARIAAAEALATRLLTLPFAPIAGHVAGYWAMDGEIALHVWQLRLPPNVRYCLPVLSDDTLLRFAPWRPGDALVTNRFGIPEPAEAEALPAEAMNMIVLPLVGFDANGQRLGMGGGWYDRSLAFRRDRPAPPPWLVGAGFNVQRIDTLPIEPWDVALDAICTESDTFNLPPRTP